ncbi:MAG TPA: nuclear transport factor 2 family protein [Gaiellaceae bacterium]
MEEFLIEDFIRLETQVWRALANGDADADGRMLSDDFLGVYPTGFADRTDHIGQLADGPTIATFALHDARMIAVSESAVMLSYRAEFEHRTSDVPSGMQAMYVSSLWCRRGGKWLNVFSQDTPAGLTDFEREFAHDTPRDRELHRGGATD